MVNITKKNLEDNLIKNAWVKMRKEIDKNKELKESFKKFFTTSELVMIEKRLAIIILLEKGYSYLDIRHILDVSPGTVSFIKQGFKINKRPIKQFSKPNIISVKNRDRRKFSRYKGARGFGLSEW